MRSCEEKEERLMLLESWRDFEKEFGSDGSRDRVRKLLPEKVKKRRKLTAEDGVRAEHTLQRLLSCLKCFNNSRKTSRFRLQSKVFLFFSFMILTHWTVTESESLRANLI